MEYLRNVDQLPSGRQDRRAMSDQVLKRCSSHMFRIMEFQSVFRYSNHQSMPDFWGSSSEAVREALSHNLMSVPKGINCQAPPNV